MARRNIRVDSSVVQGDGTWVEFRPFSWGEAKRLTERIGTLNESEYVAETERLILDRLVAWNWTDGDGRALALPRSVEELNALTLQEIAFLSAQVTELLKGSTVETKN